MVEAAPVARYGARMRSVILRLLTLAAVLMLPFGMTAAPAEALPAPGMAASMPMEHCPDAPASKGSSGSLGQCTMACSAALPADDAPTVELHGAGRTPVEMAVTSALAGIELEIATPPPRHS